jgi:pimeloyl-ACP methyl ester carboxylesterase
MPTITSADGEIYYDVHGAGTPVMLVSGLGGTGSYWNPNLPAFAKRHQVIVHDHRGMGKSSRSRIRYSVDQMTADLLAVMDHLRIEKAHLVGHSTGGAIGQTLAATHPDRLLSLVISASWTKADPYFRRMFEARRALLTVVVLQPTFVRPRSFSIRAGGSTRTSVCLKTVRKSPLRGFRRPRLLAAESTLFSNSIVPLICRN